MPVTRLEVRIWEPGSGPVVVDTTAHVTTSPAEAPRRPLGHLPLWGGAAAAFLAAWAAYARRKRLQHAIEDARERAARAARLAAQRMKAAALIAAVALDLAKRKQGQGKEEDKGEGPPRPRRIPITIDGEVPLAEAASGRTPQPGYDFAAHAEAAADEIMAEKRLDYHDPLLPVNIAKWKQADYGQMAHAREVAEAGEAKPWWQRALYPTIHPVETFQNALIAVGQHFEPAREAIVATAQMVGSLNAGLNDNERNPVTAASGQSLRDGWAGLKYGIRTTLYLEYKTGAALLRGDWKGVKLYGSALAKGVVKGWVGGGIRVIRHLAWGTFKAMTPIGLFETVPTWWHAIKDAWAGKRGGWDVVFTSLLLMGNVLGIYGGINVAKTGNEFLAFQDTLSPSAQSEYISLSPIEQFKIFNAARSTNISPTAIEFYLNEVVGRPTSPLAGLPFADAMRISTLAAQSGRGAFILDYVGRYGVTDALRLAPPEVIRGMVDDGVLVQTQEMLEQNIGYNVSPESWFKSYSEIGRNGTYVTNETAIREIIGKFEGREIITISQADAEALAKALGLSPNTLTSGFRISKITGIRGMDISYPLEGNEYFLGPGRGLPGGGPEIKITPSLSIDSTSIVEQTIVQVKP